MFEGQILRLRCASLRMTKRGWAPLSINALSTGSAQGELFSVFVYSFRVGKKKLDFQDRFDTL
jgi:hypothetical protein